MYKRYFYESHMGGWYDSDKELGADDLYCEECGDCDMLIGVKEFSREPKKEKIERIGNKLYYDYMKSWDMVE